MMLASNNMYGLRGGGGGGVFKTKNLCVFNKKILMGFVLCYSSVEFVDRQGAIQFQLEDFPPELHKKVTLLKYFKNYMTEHLVEVRVCFCFLIVVLACINA
jgi:hypothetical protein